METNAIRLRRLADRAQRLANGVSDSSLRQRLLAASKEFEQRAKEVEVDDATGQ